MIIKKGTRRKSTLTNKQRFSNFKVHPNDKVEVNKEGNPSDTINVNSYYQVLMHEDSM